jgi:hypothetical protein
MAFSDRSAKKRQIPEKKAAKRLHDLRFFPLVEMIRAPRMSSRSKREIPIGHFFKSSQKMQKRVQLVPLIALDYSYQALKRQNDERERLPTRQPLKTHPSR